MAGSKLNVRFYVTQANVRFPCDFSVNQGFAKDRGAAGMEKLCGNCALALLFAKVSDLDFRQS